MYLRWYQYTDCWNVKTIEALWTIESAVGKERQSGWWQFSVKKYDWSWKGIMHQTYKTDESLLSRELRKKKNILGDRLKGQMDDCLFILGAEWNGMAVWEN